MSAYAVEQERTVTLKDKRTVLLRLAVLAEILPSNTNMIRLASNGSNNVSVEKSSDSVCVTTMV